MPGEASTNLQVIGMPVKEAFENFALDTGIRQGGGGGGEGRVSYVGSWMKCFSLVSH